MKRQRKTTNNNDNTMKRQRKTTNNNENSKEQHVNTTTDLKPMGVKLVTITLITTTKNNENNN